MWLLVLLALAVAATAQPTTVALSKGAKASVRLGRVQINGADTTVVPRPKYSNPPLTISFDGRFAGGLRIARYDEQWAIRILPNRKLRWITADSVLTSQDPLPSGRQQLQIRYRNNTTTFHQRTDRRVDGAGWTTLPIQRRRLRFVRINPADTTWRVTPADTTLDLTELTPAVYDSTLIATPADTLYPNMRVIYDNNNNPIDTLFVHRYTAYDSTWNATRNEWEYTPTDSVKIMHITPPDTAYTLTLLTPAVYDTVFNITPADSTQIITPADSVFRAKVGRPDRRLVIGGEFRPLVLRRFRIAKPGTTLVDLDLATSMAQGGRRRAIVDATATPWSLLGDGVVAQQTLYVSTTGDDGNNGLSVATPLATLAAAAAQALPGATVYVVPGTYQQRWPRFARGVQILRAPGSTGRIKILAP